MFKKIFFSSLAPFIVTLVSMAFFIATISYFFNNFDSTPDINELEPLWVTIMSYSMFVLIPYGFILSIVKIKDKQRLGLNITALIVNSLLLLPYSLAVLFLAAFLMQL